MKFTSDDLVSAKQRYLEQKNACKYRVDMNGDPIEFRLTFVEWCIIWDNSGHWGERGRKANEYCMSRRNDIGHYEVGNIDIITCRENTKSGNFNQFNTLNTRNKHKKSMDAWLLKGKNNGPLECYCLGCKKKTSNTALKRFHKECI